jgi:hypothetical protein
MALSKWAADGSRRAVRPGELIRFDSKSERGPATFKGVTCFLGTSRLTCRRSVLERLLPSPEVLVIEADEYLFTLGGAVAEVAVLDEPLCYYRLHGHNLYQFSDYDPARLRRKHSVVATLAGALPKRLTALGVPEANTRTRSSRILYTTPDGLAWRPTVATSDRHSGPEWAVMQAHRGQWPWLGGQSKQSCCC